MLPILPSPSWKPSHAGDPSLRILLLLTATIGLPYLLLSTTSPLLQAWYVAAKPGAIPYRLFALSNFGSLLALLSYPVFVEPMFTTHGQAYGWSGIYVVFAVICAAVAWKACARRREQSQEPVAAATTPPPVGPSASYGPRWRPALPRCCSPSAITSARTSRPFRFCGCCLSPFICSASSCASSATRSTIAASFCPCW